MAKRAPFAATQTLRPARDYTSLADAWFSQSVALFRQDHQLAAKAADAFGTGVAAVYDFYYMAHQALIASNDASEAQGGPLDLTSKEAFDLVTRALPKNIYTSAILKAFERVRGHYPVSGAVSRAESYSGFSGFINNDQPA